MSSILKDASAIQSNDFVDLIEKITGLLRNEKGRIGNFTVTNRLVRLDPLGEALVIGDLHGDLQSLNTILQNSRFIEKLERSKEACIIFLGDYGDRGTKSVEIFYLILNLKLAFPEKTLLLRGNHEAPASMLAYPHDLPYQFQIKFGKGWENIYKKTRALFDYLYNAVYVEERYVMIHGGISQKINSLQDIANADESGPYGVLEDLLWSDPTENEVDAIPSPRGAGQLFGKQVTEKILEKLNVKVLIRGHESSEEGFKFNHDAKVLTLFSRKGSPYFNPHGAYLRLPLYSMVDNGYQLVRLIHKF